MNYKSHIPDSQKENIIKNEIKRIKDRCTTEQRYEKQIQNFKERLILNNFPRTSTLINSQPRRRRRDRRDIPTFYLEMPFLGNKQEHKIKNLFRRHGINIRLYRRSATLANYLRPARETNLICSIPHCPIKKTNNGNKCFTKNCVRRKM